MVYLIGWGLIYYSLAVHAVAVYRGRAFGVLIICFFAGVAVLRGATGTDTQAYESIFSSFLTGDTSVGLEPGFAILGFLVSDLLGSAELGVRAVSALFYVLVFFYYVRADRNEGFYFLAYLVPAYFYSYSMNVLRLGIASIVFLLAVQALRRCRLFAAGSTMLAAVSFHYSILFSIGFLGVIFFARIGFFRLLFVFLAVILFFYFSGDYIALKIGVYSDFEANEKYSGLSKVLVVLIFVVGVFFSRIPAPSRWRIGVLSVFFLMFSVWIAMFSYAGLRLLDLVAFVLPVVIVFAHSRSGVDFNWEVKSAFLLSGLASAGAVYRGFLGEEGVGESPFLPYELMGGLF